MMKIGKQPKRFGGPSKKFLEKTMEQGDVHHLYLDDERPCPSGWTVARSADKFFDILDREGVADRVTHLSLDWYLGYDEPNGIVVAKRIAESFKNNLNYLPNLKAIGLHSSDRDRALEMFHILHDAISEERIYDIGINFDLCTPRIT